ncbi:MAG: phosphotransferase family protein [Anaerolineae bacterium]
MPLLDNLSSAQLQRALDAIGSGYTLQAVKAPQSGYGRNTLVLHTARGDLVLRVFGAEQAWKAAKERLIFGLMAQHAIPAPRVLRLDLSCALLPLAYTISEMLPGATLGSVFDSLTLAQQVDYYRQLGDHLGRLHAITFDRFGDLAERQGSLCVGLARELQGGGWSAGPFTNWRAMHQAIIAMRLHALEGSPFADLVSPVRAYYARSDALLDYPITPRLLHMDLHAGNVLVYQGRISGLIDAEESIVGHNEYDLMRTDLAHFEGEDERLHAAFYGAYASHCPLDDGYAERRPFYQLSRTLVQLRCLIAYGDQYTADLEGDGRRAREDVARVLAEAS